METVTRTVAECQKLVSDVCAKRDCLTKAQRDALGVSLYFESGDGSYLAVCDFLEYAEMIDMFTKAELLQLI